MQEEGLFRRSPSSALLRAAQEAYDRGNVVSLESFADPHLAAVLLKKYLRDLPDPIFPERTYGVIKRCPLPSAAAGDDDLEQAIIVYIREILLPDLVPCALILLSQVLRKFCRFCLASYLLNVPQTYYMTCRCVVITIGWTQQIWPSSFARISSKAPIQCATS